MYFLGRLEWKMKCDFSKREFSFWQAVQALIEGEIGEDWLYLALFVWVVAGSWVWAWNAAVDSLWSQQLNLI